jgi:hypothetical protein
LNEIRTNFWNALIGLAMVLVGLPVYWIWLSGRSRVTPQAAVDRSST